MVDTVSRSPLHTTIALIAAGAVALSPMTLELPTPPALTAPTISIQNVQLTALGEPLPAARGAEASASANSVVYGAQDIPTAIVNGLTGLISSPIAGAGAGIFFGFIGGGLLATSLLGGVPEGLRELVSPIVPATAILGAIIGAPIGAVVVPILFVASAVHDIFSPATPAAATRASVIRARVAASPADAAKPSVGRPHRAHRANAVPQRVSAKADASRASAFTAPQQHSKSARKATGHTPNASPTKAARSGR